MVCSNFNKSVILIHWYNVHARKMRLSFRVQCYFR